MPNLSTAMAGINRLEELANGNTSIHHIHPVAKLLVTMVYLVTVISFGRYQISGLLPYLFYPVILMALGDIPYKPLLARLLIAIPFPLFAGLANLWYDRAPALTVTSITFSFGAVSLISLFIKTGLTVMAVLIFAASTPIRDLANALAWLKFPRILILQLVMTYRYIGVLIDETRQMHTAYLLRATGEKGIQIRHAGVFLGQLLLRSFDRAERIYIAMTLKGYANVENMTNRLPLRWQDILYLLSLTGVFIALRYVNISQWIDTLLH